MIFDGDSYPPKQQPSSFAIMVAMTVLVVLALIIEHVM